MRYIIAISLVIVLILSAVPSYAHRGGNVDVEIVSDYGDEFFTIPFEDKTIGRTQIIKNYLEAKRSEKYNIVLRNNTAERVGVVVAVEGRNIISGKKSFLKNNESMYVVSPFGYTKVEGWRTDQNTVHRFYFTDKFDSYAVKTFGDSSAMGVIAVSVFCEKEKPGIFRKQRMQEEKSSVAPSGPSAKSQLKGFESDTAGTGFGDEKYSPVVEVQFEPESIPYKKILVKYEWRDVLCKKGLMKCWAEENNRLWDEDRYAPFPPDYINP
jgi:hypothetical protein